MTLELPVQNGLVERGEEVTKMAVIDRYHAVKKLGKMFGKMSAPKLRIRIGLFGKP